MTGKVRVSEALDIFVQPDPATGQVVVGMTLPGAERVVVRKLDPKVAAWLGHDIAGTALQMIAPPATSGRVKT